MDKRPIIKLELTQYDRSLEIIGWLSVLGIWILSAAFYSKLPDTIPTHYNAVGQPNSFGGKIAILTLPLISTIVFLVITILNKYPHIFNYPTKITQENAFAQYLIATRTLRLLKLIVVVIFGAIVFKTIQNANGHSEGHGIWFLIISLALIFIPIILLIVKSYRIK